MRIDFEVSCGQFAVLASSLIQPFNDWTIRHVTQGFAWRPGSVSFRCMVEAGNHSVEIAVANHVGAVHSDAERVHINHAPWFNLETLKSIYRTGEAEPEVSGNMRTDPDPSNDVGSAGQ